MRQTLDILQARVSELEKELGGMKTALGQEKEGRERALNEKITLEGEIESLSQALFEEVRISFFLFCIIHNFNIMCRPTRWSSRNASGVLRLKTSSGKPNVRKTR